MRISDWSSDVCSSDLGALYPGTIGAICLLVGLYALAALPVNYAGIALILLGVALMAGEAFAPSFGILGIGGIIAFVLGATILIDTDMPEFRISWPLLARSEERRVRKVCFSP